MGFLSKFIQNRDVFGSPVQLTHNGERKFSSTCGGLLSLIAFGLFVWFVVLLFTAPLDLKVKNISATTSAGAGTTIINQGTTFETSIQTKEYSVKMEYSEGTYPTHNLTSNGFGIAFHRDFRYDSDFGKPEAYTATYSNGSSDVFTGQDYGYCNQTTFPIDDWARAEALEIEGMHCLDVPELTLRADILADDAQVIFYGFEKCSGSGCETDTGELDDYYNDLLTQAFAVNSYYDSSTPEDPIKKYIKYLGECEVNYNTYVVSAIHVRENEIRFLNGTTATFYDAEPFFKYSSSYITKDPRYISDFRVSMSDEKRIYEQYEAYTPVTTRNLATNTSTNAEAEYDTGTVEYIFYLCSLMGGFCYFLKVVFGTVNSLFLENLQVASMLNRIKKVRAINAAKEERERMSQSMKPEENKDGDIEINTFQKLQSEIGLKNDKTQLQTKALERKKSMAKPRSRAPYQYTCCDVFWRSICCCFIPNGEPKKTKYQKPQETVQKNSLAKFNLDRQKLYKEIDLVRIVNELKDLRAEVSKLQQEKIDIATRLENRIVAKIAEEEKE